MGKRFLILQLLAILLFLVCFDGFLSRLPFQAAVILILFLSVFGRRQTVFLWAIILGIFLDGSFAWPAGVFLIALLLAVSLVLFLSENFVTSRSFYSLLILIPVGTMVFESVALILTKFLAILNLVDFFFPPTLGYLTKIIIANTLASVLIFFVVNFLSQKFKSSFLIKV